MKYVFACIAALFLVACNDEFGADPTTDANAAGLQMTSLVARSQTFAAIPQQCPLSVYKTRQALSMTTPDCAQDPSACLAQCEAGNASACFDAARTIEKGDIANDSDWTYPLFMAACELGSANACVNTAATVKNGDWSQARPSAAGTAQCQFQTYDRMCKDGAAWGCYMVAQEYRRSDGFRPQSDARYESNMRRACQISSTSGACLDRFNN